ncbi:hypothetical protein BCIN_07g01870 [Botrytis cinerea B05.10]|uniref:Uncharacterized protein n=1 Tax=Botryotinia fuckeliana (strain B05.10) TaxID=332648 RepID=A0A384JMH7_BOTFB|nr:hypothetical protein BCIN_07g01870 [Botrytis cinerea B05.10]ATZ51577.1 hypothetical protein BCIN_07g01870 [Botrytis cinerea B05.10]
MSSLQNTASPNMDRRSSLRTRVPKLPDIKGPSSSARKSLRQLLRQPTTATETVALSPMNTTAAAFVTAFTPRTYRSIYPKLDVVPVSSEPAEQIAIVTNNSSSSASPKKKMRLRKQIPPSSTNKHAVSGISSLDLKTSAQANSTKESPKAHDKQSVINLARTSIPLASTHKIISDLDSQDEDKMPARKSTMVPKRSRSSSQNSSQNNKKRSRQMFEEPEKICMISCGIGGQLDEYATFYFTETDFKALLETAPHFNKFRKPYSNSIYIRGYMALSSRVIIQWLTKGTIMPLELHKPGRADGFSNYPFVHTYIMANDFDLPEMCDELMDTAMRELWGSGDEAVILPDARDLYTVYSQTHPGNPLRKLYIAVFDWLLTSDECNRDTGRPRISSSELWNLLSRSENAGIDYINYCRSQITDRGTYEHPLDPRKWNLCELHQHFPFNDCPMWIKQRNAVLEDN